MVCGPGQGCHGTMTESRGSRLLSVVLVRAGTVVALLAVVTAVQLMVDEPGLGVTFYALIPIVLAAF